MEDEETKERKTSRRLNLDRSEKKKTWREDLRDHRIPGQMDQEQSGSENIAKGVDAYEEN